MSCIGLYNRRFLFLILHPSTRETIVQWCYMYNCFCMSWPKGNFLLFLQNYIPVTYIVSVPNIGILIAIILVLVTMYFYALDTCKYTIVKYLCIKQFIMQILYSFTVQSFSCVRDINFTTSRKHIQQFMHIIQELMIKSHIRIIECHYVDWWSKTKYWEQRYLYCSLSDSIVS